MYYIFLNILIFEIKLYVNHKKKKTTEDKNIANHNNDGEEEYTNL